MNLHKPRSIFPRLMVILTLILGITIVLTVRSGVSSGDDVVVSDDVVFDVGDDEVFGDVVSDVDIDAYKDDLVSVLEGVWGVVDGEGASGEFIGEIRDRVIGLVVPVDFRDLHLDIVVGLNKLQKGVLGDDASFAEAQIIFSRIKDENIWLMK